MDADLIKNNKSVTSSADRQERNAPFFSSVKKSRPFFQPKLTVGPADDVYEREADAVADRVMRMKDGKDVLQPNISSLSVQRMCAECGKEEEKNHVQRKEQDHNPHTEAPSIVHDVVRAGGRAIDADTRSFMENRIGYDFSNVKIHTGSLAAKSARAINALAYTSGNNIVFNEGQYAPGTERGKKLLAHELTHTIQQGNSTAVQTKIARTPLEGIGGTQTLHNELIEKFRRANGLPPHGIDPATGLQVGPTDSEIRFGGLLDTWLMANRGQGTSQTGTASGQPPAAVRSVTAPATAPALTGTGSTNVVGMCASLPNWGECRQHKNYILNILPQAIRNIRAVPSPYSAAIETMYSSVLPNLGASAIPAVRGGWVHVSGGAFSITFGTLTHNFTNFEILLQNWPGGVNGWALSLGGPVAAIVLNEASSDALSGNLAGLEETMVHEAMHILADVTMAVNSNRAPGAAMANANLDHASYASIQAGLATALLPFITRIGQLPSFGGAPPSTTAQQDATSTANTFINETIARTEAGIFRNQRAGRGFAAPDLRAQRVFTHVRNYWSPTPPVAQELQTFIQTNQSQIDTAILPFIYQTGENYLNLRP